MKNEQGRSMVEMLGVIAIIGVLSLAGLAGYQKATAKHKMNRTVNQMAQIVNNVRTAFLISKNGDKPYYMFGKTKTESVDGMKKAVALRVFPDEMIVNKTDPKIVNLYKGDVYIISEDDGQTFEVVFEDLPKEVSVTIGTMDWGLADVSGLQEVLINNAEEESEGGEGGGEGE